jgi:YihY family inner membrane protein
VSSAAAVPETRDLVDDDPRRVLAASGLWRLLADGVARLRWADGFSHARATAFQLVLALVPGVVVLVALASLWQWGTLSDAIVSTADSVAPGPAGDVLREAFAQGRDAGSHTDWAAIAAGALALVVSGTTAFGQVERSANRIYGIEADRPSVQKYRHAFVLLVTAGALIGLSLAVIGLGADWDAVTGDGVAHDLWVLARWPLGAALLTLGVSAVFRTAPRRRQPTWPWLSTGAALASGGIVLVTVLLSLFLRASGSFGDTYGPLAGFMGLLLWAYLSCVALYAGLAVAAQLEAVRGGRAAPRSASKVEAGEPDAQTVSYATALGGNHEQAQAP